MINQEYRVNFDGTFFHLVLWARKDIDSNWIPVVAPMYSKRIDDIFDWIKKEQALMVTQ